MKWFKRIFLVVNVLLFLAVGIGLWAAYTYQDRIVPFAVEQVNRYLKTPVQVEHISLSFLEKFPQASLRFDDVSALGSNARHPDDTLFQFNHVYLTFDLLDLYKGQYNLQHIEVEDGFLRLHTDRSGTRNFDFVQDIQDSTTDSRFQLNLQKIVIRDARIRWEHERFDQWIDIDVNKVTAKGAFSETQHETALYGSLLVHRLGFGEATYFQEEPLFLDLAGTADTEAEYYAISRGIFRLRDTYDLEATGKLARDNYTFNLTGKELDLEVLFPFLPQSISRQIQAGSPKGKLNLNLSSHRDPGETRSAYEVDFELLESSWRVEALDDPFTNLYARGRYANGKQRNVASSFLRIDSLHAELASSDATGQLQLRNFEKPYLQARLSGGGTLASWKGYFPADSVEEISGNVHYRIQVKGNWPLADSVSWKDWLALEKQAHVNADEVRFQWVGWEYPVVIDSLDADVDDVAVIVNQASGSVGETVFNITGFTQTPIREWVEQGKPSDFQGEVYLSYLNWPVAEEDAEASTLLPQDISVNVDLVLDSFRYDRFTAQGIRATVQLNPSGLSIRNYRLQALNGSGSGSLSLTRQPDGYALKTRSIFRKVNLSALFYAFREFGQSSISHSHLRGTSTIDMNLTAQLDSSGNFNLPTLKAQGDVTVQDGELIEYKPLYSIVDDFRENKVLRLFIKLDDFEKRLHHVRFQQLTNTIEISDETVFIPSMFIQSSALDLKLSGSQHFTDSMSYNIGFNLKEVLLRKGQNVTEGKYGYIADDGTGNKMVFLHITGTPDDPQVSFDRKASRAHNRAVVKREVSTTKAVLNQELGLFKSEEHPELEQAPPETDLQLDFGEFEEDNEPNDPTTKSADSDTTSTTPPKGKKWKKLLQKVTGEESKSKFENWEFEDDDL